MSVGTEDEDADKGSDINPARDSAKETQPDRSSKAMDDALVQKLAHRQDVLEYVVDILLELAELMDGEKEVELSADLRQTADKALKAKYNDPEAS